MKKAIKPTRLEMELLEVLWKLGTASIREIQESLPEDRRPEYTTVQTIIYRLEDKGAVERVKKIGNAHIFRPLVTRKNTLGTLIDDFMTTFGGSPESLVAHLFESGRLNLRDLREIEKQLEARNEAPKP
jgi:predicted transcriptional regulator